MLSGPGNLYRRLLTAVLIVASCSSASNVRAQPAAAANKPANPMAAPTTQSFVFLRAPHPVFIRLSVLVDGIELRMSRNERIQQAFSELDSNGDQAIDQSERDGHPAALRRLGIRAKWPDLVKEIDVQPQDEKLSPAELTEYMLKQFGPPVVLARRLTGMRRSSQAVELFDLLDENQDQQLNEQEFSVLPSRLHKLDADGDDAFSVVEVEPFRNPFGARAAPAVPTPEDSPWIMTDVAAETLLKRFDQESPKNSLSAAELGVAAEQLTVADADHDGQLNLEELRQWLPTANPNYTLIVSLPQQKAGSLDVKWIDMAAPPPNPRQRVRTTKDLMTAISGQPLQLQVSAAARSSQRDNVAFYTLQFRRSDQDKNKYLSQTEFGSMNLRGATFELVDADGNGEVHDNELKDFLNLASLVNQGHVMLTYDNNEISLFSKLDLDKDNRLSPRECLKASKGWQEVDANQDGKLDRQELSGNLRLTVELVKPDLFQDGVMAAGNMNGEPVINERGAGPVWFRGMDRNKDGDISQREFLGTSQAFQKWDRDGDGLISVSEAESEGNN